MIVPSGEQLARIKTRPHRTRLWLGIYEPRTVVSARLNANDKSAADLSVTYLSGAPADIVTNMTAYLGSTIGGQEHGRIRVRSGSAGVIKVSENSLNWQENWYITVVEFYEAWSVFPRIVLDADNIPIYYRDYDVLYTDQNQYLDPIVHMGPNDAGFLTTGSYCVYYSSSGSFDPTPDSPSITGSSYLWQFGELGFVDPTGTTEQTPGYVCYHSGGFYTTDLTITVAQGQSFTGHRHVMVYDRPGEGPQRPYVEWGLDSLDGSRSDGGYQARIWLREEAGYSKVKDGSLVVVFSDDWQGSEAGAIGGNAENRDSILFVGYIDSGSITIDPVTNKIEFDVSSVTQTMKEVSNYSVLFESELEATTWYQMRQMTVDRALIGMLRWQSTILAIADFHQTGDVLNVEDADFDKGGLYDTANQFLESTIGAQMVGDRQGAIYCEVDLNLIPTGTSRTPYLTALDVERRDWRDNISFEQIPHSSLAFIEMGGLAYSGPSETGSTDAYLSGAPGDAQLWRGSVERGSGMVIYGQEQLNLLTANMLAVANAEFPEVEVPLAGDYRFIDIAPQRRVTLSIDDDETYRGFIWDKKQFIPHGMVFNYAPDKQSMLVDMTLREETSATETGETILIPEAPPYDNPTIPPWEIPFDPIMPVDPVIPPVDPPPATGNVVYVMFQNVLARTNDFWSVSPSWEKVVVPADLTESTSFNLFRIDPFDSRNTAYIISFYSGQYTIHRTSNLSAPTPTWTLVFTRAQGQTLLGPDNQTTLSHMGCWPVTGNVLLVGGMGSHACLPGNQCPKFIRSPDGGDTWTEAHAGAWQSQVLGAPMMVQVPYFGNATVYASRAGDGRLWKSIDVGLNWTEKWHDGPVYAICNPHASGETVFAVTNLNIGVPAGDKEVRRSIDGGDTWVEYPFFHRGNNMAPYAVGSTAGDLSDNFHYHRVGDMYFGMMAGGGVSTFVLFNESWIALADFAGEIYPYMLHNLNVNYHYALGNAVDGWIVGSHDTGSTWYNKEGDFATSVMSWAAAAGKKSIQPVHSI